MERFFKRPWLIVAAIVLVTAFFAVQLPRVRLDNNNYRFIPKTNPARVESDYVEDTFGSQVMILVGLERRYGTVFDAPFIEQIRDYESRLATVPGIDEVSSLLSTDYITGEGDSIVVRPIVPDGFAGTAEEVAETKRRVLSWDAYERSLVSEDLSATQVVVTLTVTAEEAGGPVSLAALEKIKSVAHEVFDGTGTEVYVAGLPVFSSEINRSTRMDIRMLVPLVILVVLSVLLLSFRRGIAIVLPLVTVLIATIWSVGAMPLVGVKMSVLSTVLPVILVAVGSAYGIHVVSHYVDEREVAGDLSREEHRRLVIELTRRIGKPVFLAALTTFVGFVSFCVTAVLPIREFGIFASFGVVASFLVSVTLIPAVFLIRGPKPLAPKLFSKRARKESAADGAPSDPLSVAIADAFTAMTRRKRGVLLLAGGIAVLSFVGLSRLVIDNVMVEYFKEGTDVVRSDAFIRRHFGGSKTLSVVVKAEKPGDVLDPAILGPMDRLARYLDGRVPEVGKVLSFTDLVKRVNQVYNADEPAEGIRAAARPQAGAQSSAQGAADGLGDLGDLGFGDFGSFEESAEPVASSSAVASSSKSGASDSTGPALDARALAEILDRSARDRGGDGLDGRALARAVARSVNLDGQAYYEIPEDPARYGKQSREELKGIVSNYMMLLSGDISSFANDPLEPTAVRMGVQLNTTGEVDTARALAEIDGFVKANFPKGCEVIVAGFAEVERALNVLVVGSQVSSVFISLLMVFLIVAFSYRSAVAGLIGVAPLSISILLNFAIMGVAGIKLNIGTALVASISVGIGIDYTIHYIAAYVREWRATKGEGEFLRRTFMTSGKAILINAVSVGAGFAVLVLSRFNMLAQLGFLIAFTMFTSSFVALTVLPVMLNWIKPAFVAKEN